MKQDNVVFTRPQFSEQGALAPARIGQQQIPIVLGSPVQLTGLEMLDRDAFGRGEIDTVNPMAPFAPDGGQQGVIVSPQGELNDLAQFFREFPTAPVMQFSPAVAAVLLAANVAQDLLLPDGTTVIGLYADRYPFYVSKLGNAEIPSATNLPSVGGYTNDNRYRSIPIFAPLPWLFYVGGLRSLSVITPTANTLVSAQCYITNKRPTVKDQSRDDQPVN